METGLIVITFVLIVAIVGLLLYAVLGKRSSNKKSTCGTLYVNLNSNAESGLFLDLDVPIEEVASEKQVVFSVHILR